MKVTITNDSAVLANTGEGERDLVLLHGWGLNVRSVELHLQARLAPHFRLHPGRSAGVRPQPGSAPPLEQMTGRAGGRPVAGPWLGWLLEWAGQPWR